MNLSALYLSLKRLSELVDLTRWSSGAEAGAIREVGGAFRTSVTFAVETAALEWLSRNAPPTLGELLATGRAIPGAMFTHVGTFYGKGIGAATARYDQGKALKDTPFIWIKLSSFLSGATLHIQVHPENLTSASAPGELGRRQQLLLLGRLTDTSTPQLLAQAYVIGYFYPSDRAKQPSADRFGRLPWDMELFPSQIDNFGAIAHAPAPTLKQIEGLRKIPEVEIKNAFAEIVGEAFVPKDWGGERSDLFTNQLKVSGERVTAAFAFKGPAVFHPLTMADLGKNGDQISRLFSEPADVFVLQHCHQVTTAVRDHMRAFATRIWRLRPFTIINGSDTVRILTTYAKCGY